MSHCEYGSTRLALVTLKLTERLMGTFLDMLLHGVRLSSEALECLGVCSHGGETMSGDLEQSSRE